MQNVKLFLECGWCVRSGFSFFVNSQVPFAELSEGRKTSSKEERGSLVLRCLPTPEHWYRVTRSWLCWLGTTEYILLA